MLNDENLLDWVGVAVVGFAIVAGLNALNGGANPLEVLKATSPMVLAGIAAIGGISVLLAFFKNR